MNIALLIVILYMVVLMAVSWYSAYRQRGQSGDGFLFADKQLPWPLVGVMIAGIAIGGSSTVGIAQNSYTMGLSAGWYDVAWAAGALVMGLFFAEKMRASEQKTVNQMLGAVFGDTFQTISAFLQIIINIVIIALQIIAGGAILTALLPDFFTMKLGIIVSAIVFGLISTVGGMLAASLTNVVNLIVIYVGIIVGVVAAITTFGDFETINLSLPTGMSGDGSHWYSLVKGMGMTAISAWFITMILQGIPNGGVLQSVISAKDPKHAKKGAIFGAILMVPAGFLSAIFGIIAAGQFPGLASSAMALPSIVMMLPGWIAGILLAGLWAADVSTATGLMMGAGSMFCEDILYKRFIKNADRKKQIMISRIVVFVIVIISYILATQISSILGSLMKALSLFAPYAILMTSIYIFPKTAKRYTGWITLIAGIVCFVIVQFIMPELRIAGQAIYSVFLVSLIAFVVSQLDKVPAPVENLYKK